MTTTKYDTLYENMKNRFTVSSEGTEYTLGEYMLMKATKKKCDAALPVETRHTANKGERALTQVVAFFNDKLTIKAPPAKDKTIRAFPFRTSASAVLSAVVACSFMLCFSFIGARLFASTTPASDEVSITEYAPELENEVSTQYYV